MCYLRVVLMVCLRVRRTWVLEMLSSFAANPIIMPARTVLLLVLVSLGMLRGAEMIQPASPDGDAPWIPQAVDERTFDVLFTNSPFTRSVDPSDSIILTGIATIEGEVFATLLDTATQRSQVVSKTANAQGWQLIGVGGDEATSRTWTAEIRVAGGEVISVRYQKPPAKKPGTTPGSGSGGGGSTGKAPPLSSGQLAEAKKAAVDYREGFSSDGYPNKPPPEMVAKLSRLSVTQREEINQQMLGLRNRGLGLEERRKIYENLVDRSTQGRR
jgi:hypothetical protein